jgi:ribosome-binding factor A
MSRRTERLGSVIRQELAMMIMRDLSDPRLVGMPSITRVEVAEDLSVADVYITVMGTAGQKTAALNALKHSAGMMRTKLTKALSIRQTPFLKFQIDEDLKKELEMMELLDKVARENAELDRRRASRAAGGGADTTNDTGNSG